MAGTCAAGKRASGNEKHADEEKEKSICYTANPRAFSPLALPGCCIAKFTGRENTIEWILWEWVSRRCQFFSDPIASRKLFYIWAAFVS